MTHDTDLPGDEEPEACTCPCAQVVIRCVIEGPRPDDQGWRLDLRAVDPARRGRLTAALPPSLVAGIEARTGHPLRPADLVGEHVVQLTVTIDPDGELIGRIVNLDLAVEHDDVPRARSERDEAVKARLAADGLLSLQGSLPKIDRLRRVAMIEPQAGNPREASVRLADWEAQGLLTLLPFPIAFDGPQAVADLHQALDCAYGQYEWGTLDALIVILDGVRELDALSDETLLRRFCEIPVPILVVRPDRPTLLCELAHLAVDGAAELVAQLTAILQRELRLADYPRLAAIARTLSPPAPATRQGPLFEA